MRLTPKGLRRPFGPRETPSTSNTLSSPSNSNKGNSYFSRAPAPRGGLFIRDVAFFLEVFVYTKYAMKKQTIGFIGLGMMGKYMAKNLLKNGYSVVGYNRSQKVLNELEKDGLHPAESLKEVAKRCDMIILMLPSSKETHDVLFHKDGLFSGLKRGHTVIDMSTSNPAETKKIQQTLKKKGVEMLDAPVSRGQKGAIAGTLSIMVGGDKKTFSKCLPIFKAMGEYVVYLGPFGSGMYVKALNNFLFAMNLLASSQGLSILRKNNVDIEKAIDVITESSGGNKALSITMRSRLKDTHPAIGFYLRYMAKDMNIFHSIVNSQKVEHTLAKPVANFFNSFSKKYTDKDAMYTFEHFVDTKAK